MHNQPSKKSDRTSRQPLTAEQIQSLLEAASSSGLEALLLLALSAGLRRSELLGLKWTDLDLDQGTFQVQRALEYRHLSTYEECGPKTEQARRQVDLPVPAVHALLSRRECQERQRIQAGANWQEADWIFTGAEGQPLSLVSVLQRFKQIQVAAGCLICSFMICV